MPRDLAAAADAMTRRPRAVIYEAIGALGSFGPSIISICTRLQIKREVIHRAAD